MPMREANKNEAEAPNMTRLGLIHTVWSLAATFDGLASELLPGVKTTVVVDELLLQDTIRRGAISRESVTRLALHIDALDRFGVDRVLVTCSSLGPAVDELAGRASIKVSRVDEPLADAAVTSGPRIGVIGTVATTLAPTSELIGRRADAAGETVTVESYLCEGAFEALARGDKAAHDEIVRIGLRSLADRSDVIVLAQASTARVLAEGELQLGIPVLSSPRLAMLRLAGKVDS
jgi:Asp/Glu/hydantoin racemase